MCSCTVNCSMKNHLFLCFYFICRHDESKRRLKNVSIILHIHKLFSVILFPCSCFVPLSEPSKGTPNTNAKSAYIRQPVFNISSINPVGGNYGAEVPPPDCDASIPVALRLNGKGGSFTDLNLGHMCCMCEHVSTVCTQSCVCCWYLTCF